MIFIYTSWIFKECGYLTICTCIDRAAVYISARASLFICDVPENSARLRIGLVGKRRPKIA